MPDIFTETHRRVNALERQVNSLSRQAKAHGWQLLSSFDMHRYGGGRLMWQLDGHSVHMGAHNSIWTENAITAANYRSTTYGGPYITVDGAAEYLSQADAAWLETGTEELLVWGWGYLDSPLPGGQACLAAKFDIAGGINQRSWKLRFDAGATSVAFDVSADGTAGGQVTITGTYTIVVETWYFIAGYFEASTQMIVYVGANTDTELTKATLAVGVPAQAFDSNADLTIGANATPAAYWDGRIGIVLGRANVPSTNIDEHLGMLFQSTRDFYAE